MSDQSREKRQLNRIPLQLLLSYEAGGKLIDNFSYNFSPGGMFIETRTPLPVGTEIIIKFELPHNGKEVHIAGDIVWVKIAGSPKGMGVEFKDFTDEKKAILLAAMDDLDRVG